MTALRVDRRVRNLSGQHGRLLIVEKVQHGGRSAYVCRCSKCGELTRPRRAYSVLQPGASCGTRKCKYGVSEPRSAHDHNEEPVDFEDAGDPIWRSRAHTLARLVSAPSTTDAMARLGAKLGWTRALFNEVLASAWGVELVKSNGLWSAARLTIKLVTPTKLGIRA